MGCVMPLQVMVSPWFMDHIMALQVMVPPWVMDCAMAFQVMVSPWVMEKPYPGGASSSNSFTSRVPSTARGEAGGFEHGPVVWCGKIAKEERTMNEPLQ